jgi:hypothetical protein
MLRAMHAEVAVALSPEETIPAGWLVALLQEPGVPHASKLAKLMNVDVNTVSRWKRGRVPLSKSRWMALLSAAGKPADWQPPPSTETH